MPNEPTNIYSALYAPFKNVEISRLSTDSNQQSNSIGTSNKNSGYTTRSKRADLIFPVSRVENQLRKGRYSERLTQTASVYLASVLEYLVAETLELAGDMTHKSKRKRITPRDISLVIKNDDELARLCANVTIPEGGVVPHIHQVLLHTKKRRRTRRVKFSQESIQQSSSKQSIKANNRVSSDTDGYLSSDSSDMDDSDLQM